MSNMRRHTDAFNSVHIASLRFENAAILLRGSIHYVFSADEHSGGVDAVKIN